MEPARARYKNYVTDQRYHNAANGTKNEMENLFIQIKDSVQYSRHPT